ncbi:NACHT domain-containing protein [Nocardia blacklockiae]|uniref:NACHT domain-containing protein n=1 Tax=Nocardia blacklockiae TaxID=480036 RepID=UPI001895E257|nr:hypothetical protein [Nocardia blacklockiae]MBF6173608.1 hypothetical protein [Nocardia blacklockiae]
MPDYDIDRLGDRAFEQLVVSLAARVLGPGVQAFGDGADGGREATFDGPINWSATSSGPTGMWNGYTVLQAKFHYHQLSPKGNAAWLKGQINTELDRWVSAMRRQTRSRAPQYLIVASNVRLSPVGVIGGIDTLTADINSRLTDPEDEVSKLGIRDFRIWHADQLYTYLDGADAVRHAFPALLTVGDVLARIGDHVSGAAIPDLASKMRLHAGQCLRNEHWIRLSEAGAPGQRAKLEDVGVDLPGVFIENIDFERTTSVHPARTVQTVAHIVEHGDAVLQRDLPDRVERPHWVIIGGPGQGKTTLSSLIAQIYRVALLGRGPMTPEVSAIVESTREALTRNGIPEPRNLRWPMRVDLANYAEGLASQPDTSLFAFLSTVIGLRTDASISPSDLHSWLRAWPWVVILDGLDEVSDAGLRRVLLERVTDFIETADNLHADLLLIATTRPLGYDERFDAELFTDVMLSRLTPQQARSFAREVVNSRHGEDPELRDRVMKRLTSASEDAATKRLMETPLQVTIMSIIVEGYGVLPVDRFGLFSLYYRTVYQREVDKPGSSIARILNEHKSDIDYLHARVALQLHVAAENAENNPTMSIPQLEAIARDRLQAQEYSPREIDTISSKLITAATHRLVLLVPAGDRIGFEVRSLQELMAAIAITSGPESAALRRLELAMHHPHWRNIWLLAAGRLFKEREHLHDQLVQVLSNGDAAGSPLQQVLASAPVLACDILDDGFAARAPKSRRRYLRQALRCLDYAATFDDRTIAASLARTCVTAEDRELLFNEISTALAAGGTRQVHAYLLLRHLDSAGPELKPKSTLLLRRSEQVIPTEILGIINRSFRLTRRQHHKRTAAPYSVGLVPTLSSRVDAMAELIVAQQTLRQDYLRYNLTFHDASALIDVLETLVEKITRESGKDVSSEVTSLGAVDPIGPRYEALDLAIEARLATLLTALHPLAWEAIDLVGLAVRPYIVRRPIGEQLLEAIT